MFWLLASFQFPSGPYSPSSNPFLISLVFDSTVLFKCQSEFVFPIRNHLLPFPFFLIACGLHDSNSHGKLHSILRQGRSTHTNPASRHSHAFAHPRTPHNCILQSWLMLMHPGWKWQDIVEGQSLNEPLWDRSWLLTIPLQLIRQGNSRPRCFTHRVPPTAAIFLFYTNKPITATDINWTPFLKVLLQPFFFFFLPVLTELHSAFPPGRLCTYTWSHICIPLGILSVSQLSQTFCTLVQPGFI